LKRLPRQAAAPPWFGWQGENRRYANEIGLLAGKLLEKIDHTPIGAREAILILAARSEASKWSPNNPASPAVKRFTETLYATLIGLWQACDDIAAPGNIVGAHHRRDHTKHLCAGCALDLIVALDAGKPTSSSTNSPIRVIAGTLFQAVTPNRTKHRRPDLREQCEEAIAQWRNMSKVDKADHIDKLWSAWTKFTGMTARRSVSIP
jgi:hypothetical protein